jgi:hypothetical protein
MNSRRPAAYAFPSFPSPPQPVSTYSSGESRLRTETSKLQFPSLSCPSLNNRKQDTAH